MVGGVPWRLSEQDPEVDSDAMKMSVAVEVRAQAQAEDEVRRVVPKIRKGLS